MGRRTTTYTVEMAGRDFGKCFVLTEMPARQAYEWAVRVLTAMINGGAPMPEDLRKAGWPALAIAAITGMRYLHGDDIIDFGNELMTCVKVREEKADRDRVESDIEEFATFALLQKAVFELHRDPFMQGVKSILGLTPTPEATAG